MHFHHLLPSPAIFAFAIIVWLIIRAVYRLTFHPLAKYPGPWLSKISSWPDAISALQSRRHLRNYELHSRYGHAVRVAPNSLSFDTTTAMHTIYTDRHANVKKTGFTAISEYSNGPQLHTASDKQLHAAKRRLLSQGFSENALRDAEGFVIQKVDELCEVLGRSQQDGPDDGWSQPRNMSHWLTLFVIDALGSLTLGDDIGALAAGQNDLPALFTATVSTFNRLAYLPPAATYIVWPFLRHRWLLETFSPKAAARRFGFRDALGKPLKRRMALEKEAEKNESLQRKDFLHYILRAKDPETGAMLPPSAYIGEAAIILGAGIDTTVTALGACLFYLLRNPEKLKRLTSEVRGAFANIEEIHMGHTMSGCVYLRACLDEAMRMTPPVTSDLTRIVEKGGIEIDGHSLPEGTIVGITLYALEHNEDHHPDTFAYLPERWLVGETTPFFNVTEDSVRAEKDAHHPFSTGPRNCIGQKLAWMEMLLVIAKITYQYDIRFSTAGYSGGGDAKSSEFRRQAADEYQLRDCFVGVGVGPTVQFRKHERALS